MNSIEGLDIDGLVAGLEPGAPPATVPPAASAAPAKPAPVAPAAKKPGVLHSALEFLKAKRGPLPTYGWGLVGAGTLAAISVAVKLRKRY